MAIDYSIHAEVVDIRSDIPKPGDAFFIDTNVWYGMTYDRASHADQPPKPYQIRDYPAYIGKARKAGARLCRCGLSLAELAHLIEKAEREIFFRTNGKIGTKEFRHNRLAERTDVVEEAQTAWGQIKAIGAPIALLVDEMTTDAALTRFRTQPIDGYDLFLLEAIAKAGITQIITDDGDFATIPMIQVFTSNHNVIKAAQNQAKLVKR